MLLSKSDLSITDKFKRTLRQTLAFCARKCIHLNWIMDKVRSKAQWQRVTLEYVALDYLTCIYLTTQQRWCFSWKHGNPSCHILDWIFPPFSQGDLYHSPAWVTPCGVVDVFFLSMYLSLTMWMCHIWQCALNLFYVCCLCVHVCVCVCVCVSGACCGVVDVVLCVL